jgi:uncharacterized protein YodC (DUF2158 family)
MKPAEVPAIDMENHHEFNVGDRVRLRTGGPTMTVESLLVESQKPVVYYCIWFTGGNRNRVGFTANQLIAAGPENTVP